MIAAEQIRGLLQAKPFQPFRIGLFDGTHYDVPNHDAALVDKDAALNVVTILP